MEVGGAEGVERCVKGMKKGLLDFIECEGKKYMNLSKEAKLTYSP